MSDITETGPQNYKDLQMENEGLSQEQLNDLYEVTRYLHTSPERFGGSFRDRIKYYGTRSGYEDLSQEAIDAGYGESRFDKKSQFIDAENIQEQRALNQSNFSKITNGLAKGVILAGTTYLDGTIGLALGLSQGLYNLFDKDPNTNFRSGLWDNDFSKAMQSINKWSEEVLPNYYTKRELNSPWYKNIFSANFIGDKFIKNLGFPIGAFYSGKLGVNVLAKLTKMPAIVASGVGTAVSAINESRIEALNNSTDWFEYQKLKLDDEFKRRRLAIERYKGTEIYNTLLEKENELYNETLNKLTEDRIKMGNMNFMMNLPLLIASNVIQFGKLYANGFKTAKKASNIVKKSGSYAVDHPIGKQISRAVLNSISEGNEELLQVVASEVPGNYYEDDFNNFYKAKIDPNAELETISWIKSFAEGLNTTLNDGSSWEQFFIGAFTGGIGMPTFGKANNAGENTYLGRNSVIGLSGGIIGELREQNEKVKRANDIVNYMNERVQSPEFKNYYQGLIRHNKYQNDMNQAVEANDEFEFKNAEHAQLISDIAMFDNAGRLEDLKTLISSAYDTSDENIASIIENTTSVLDNGNLVGPFAEFATKNADGTISANISNDESKEAVIKKLTQNRDDIFNTIKQYRTIKDEIDIRIGQQLNDEQLEELTWLKSQISNWQDRANQLSSEVKPTIGTVLGSMSQLADMYNSIKTEEGKAHAGLSDLYNSADKNERQIREDMSILEAVKGHDDKTFAHLLSSKPKLVKWVKSVIENPLSGLAADDVQTFNKKIDDIVKLVNATGKYNTKLKEYLENPAKLQEDIVSSTENIAKEEAKKKSDNLKSRLLSVTNLSEFRQALNEEENAATREETLKSLEDEDNEMAKNYREVNAYNIDVQRAINSLDESPTVKVDALKLLQDQFKNSSNLNEIANPNSIYVDNADALYDDNLTPEENAVKFQEAQYALLRAMNQINNENRFKNRFSQDYRTLREKGKPNPKAPTKDTTGDSGTSTIPPVNTDGLPVTTYESPVGNVTATQVRDENKQINDEVETPQSLDNQQKGRRPYYRPSIPELHIQGTKEGDFRPFNVVVAEREKGVDFDVLYDYLRDSGAFTYVNEGNLKVGDELGFMIDPILEKQMESYSWYKGPTILLIDKKNNQVVGSLDGSQYSIDKYEGLANLEKKIKAEFAQRNDKSKRFIATSTTRVAQVMVGKIPYGTEERSLANIPNVSREGRAPVFGIIKNGTMSTNGRLDDNLIIKPVDMTQEGRMYLLIPNAAGKHSPAAVRVKHFNKTEFNPEDIEVQNTQMYRNIQESIDLLANSLNEEDLNNAVKSLATNLYTGDLHIDWFTSDAGNGIRFTKVQRDAQGNEIYEEKDGRRIRKETVKTVFLTEKWDQNTLFSIIGDNEVLSEPASKNIEDVSKEISEILLDFNLPIQVNLGMLNKGGYNNVLINSNVLTSNISDARVISSWFTTDYFDVEGNLHQAVNPASVTPDTIRKVETPVGGTEGVITGTKVVVDGATYGVDLTTGIIYGSNNQRVYPKNAQLISDLAWASANFGDATNGSLIWNNKILLPSGQVLDRGTQKYLTGKEAQEVKDKIAGRERTVGDSKKVIAQIAENQKKVDKTRTDSEFYYILEEDGQYHEYERVHSRLGSNWVESKKQTDALKDIRVKLSQLADNVTQYNNYLKYLGNHWKVDLSAFSGKIDARSRDTIVNIIRDSMSGTNSQRALNAGTAVDSVIRNFFTSNDTPVKPGNMSEKAFTDLITSLTEIRSNIEARGERFLTNNIVLFQKYPDGTRVAGEVDILSVDADGNFRIYDVKTSRYSFYDFTDRYGNRVNYFLNPSATQKISAKDYYTLQLSAYKNLFESQYHTPITTLAVLPFVLNYNKDVVDGVTKEKGIMITYNPAVNVPLIGTVKASESTPTNSTIPVFNSALETQDPVNNVLPEYSLEDSKVGYFVRDGKLHKSYLTPIGKVNGVDVYMTKIPTITKGFGRQGEEAHVASNSYMAVFPNGNSITLIKNDPMTLTEQQAKDTIKKMLEGNPQRVSDMSNEKTLIFDPSSTPVIEAPKTETPATILSTPSVTPGAAKTAQAEQAINEHDDEFEDDLDLGSLRRVDESRSVWNQEKELEWIKKVLPQLSDNDRVRVVKGLIRVGNQGALAWGQFNNGIITLSDVAAEGTTYHEAFHVVFNLLLDNNERQALLAEAKEIYGDKSNLDLEEDMAEGFREYVMSKESKGLLNKIKNFFKDLWIKVTNWNSIRPHLTAYYQMINRGEYSNRELPVETLSQARARQEEYSKEMQDILAKAPRNSEGKLLVKPGGPVSNLDERQYAQVRTKAFKDWFGDWENDPENASKIVDKNGEPLIVYHNTPFEFNGIFDMDHKSRIMPWTSEPFGHVGTKETANTIKGTQFALFLNVKNPLETPDFVHETVSSMLSELYKQGIISKEKYSSLRGISNSELRNLMLSLGYDGTKYENKAERGGISYSFITPNQIKSATDNIGTFSAINPNIRYRMVPKTTWESVRSEDKEILENKGWTEELWNKVSQAERDQAVKCIAI